MPATRLELPCQQEVLNQCKFTLLIQVHSSLMVWGCVVFFCLFVLFFFEGEGIFVPAG